MIIVDTALQRREDEHNPIRVAIVGAGFMGRGIARQLLTPLKGIRLVAISSRDTVKAAMLFQDAGLDAAVVRDSFGDFESGLEHGRPMTTDDPALLCSSSNIDLIIECTGQFEYGARVAIQAIDGGKHLILVNSELDATLGPILKQRASRATAPAAVWPA
jgi:predicted homoserine dehydrogenase-like protein